MVRIRTSGSKQGNNCIVFTLTVLTINDLFCILQMLLMVNTVTVNADFMRCVEGDDWKCESGAFSDLPLDSKFAVLEDMRQYMEEFRDHQPTSPHFEKNLQTQLGSITVRPWMLAADMEYYASSKSSSKPLESIKGHAMKSTFTEYHNWFTTANRSSDENMDNYAVKIRRSVTASVL